MKNDDSRKIAHMENCPHRKLPTWKFSHIENCYKKYAINGSVLKVQ